MSPLFGLIGRRLGHSYSKIIHEKLGGYRYDLLELEPEAVAPFIAAGNFSGLNVTIPYKQMVIPFCARLSPAAERIGAVNTLFFNREGELCGDNTDYYGFAQMLALAGIETAGKKVLLLGSGGTCLTAQAVLADSGVSALVHVSRSGAVNYENVYEHDDAQIVVNTTPVGMFPKNGERLLDLSRLPHLESVADVIYNPERTRLLLDAAARGLRTAGGLSMLVYQAARAAEIFLGGGVPRAVDAAKVADILRETARATRNIVLIGMPGSGKTTIGQALAARLEREFIDTDAEIVKAAKQEIPEIFAAEGEKGFRRRESLAVAAAGKLSGKVIATGGGAVLRPENRDALRQNSTVVYIRRPIAALATAGRPLSCGIEALEKMLREREPLYTALADIAVDNDGISGEKLAAEICAQIAEKK